MIRDSKRAAIEVQFNWVFVIIVGAIILVFFVSIVQVQRNNSDRSLAFDLLQNIGLIMSGGITIPKTGQLFEMPRYDFNFECNSLTLFGVSRQFPDKVVFAPSVLSGRQLITWSQDWNVPFKVTNFLYLSTSNVRYIFVADEGSDYYDFARRIYDTFPDNATKEIVNTTSVAGLQDKNNYDVKFVYFDPSLLQSSQLNVPLFVQKMPDSSVSGVLVTQDQMWFYRKRGTYLEAVNEPFSYLGDPSIYGAIFADNIDLYDCSIAKAYSRLHYVSQVLLEKEVEMNQSLLSARSICPPVRAGVADLFVLLNQSTMPGSVDTSAIAGAETTFENINQLSLEKSCPPIY